MNIIDSDVADGSEVNGLVSGKRQCYSLVMNTLILSRYPIGNLRIILGNLRKFSVKLPKSSEVLNNRRETSENYGPCSVIIGRARMIFEK